MHAERCPLCGCLQHWHHQGRSPDACGLPAKVLNERRWNIAESAAAGEKFERAMDWIVGLLLSAVITGLVFVQAHYPQ